MPIGVKAIAAALLGATTLAAWQAQTPAPADFTVLENGKPQQIAVFTAVDIPDPEPPSAPWMRDVAPDVSTNDGLEERRLFLLILDDATIQSDVHAVNNVRDIARRVIDRLGPSDLAAVIFTRDNRNSQDYTADRARLLAAVDKFSVGFRDMALREMPAANDLYFMFSVNVVESAVDVLGTMPDRRKAIIYVGQGVPVDLDMLAPQAPGISLDGGESALSIQTLMAHLKNQMERVFQRAARANVNVYTIDACGLRGPLPPPPPTPAPDQTSLALPPVWTYREPTCAPGLEVEYLKTVAASTGARAVTETNDFAPGVTAIFEENASYYVMGYQSTDRREDGKLRRIEVRVNRPDVDVRTRNGYQAAKADATREKTAPAASPIGMALAGVLPRSDLPLQMSAVPFAVPGRRESAVVIVVGVRQPIRQASGRTVERVDLQVSAFNVDGKAFGSTRLQADVALRPDATGLAEYEVLSRLDLKPGRYQLRVAANLGSLSTSGSLYYDVDVPDVSSGPVSLFGLILSASPGPVVGAEDALRTILPVVPTARRTFTAGLMVSAFARVYQGGKAPLTSVAVRVQLRNASNELVMDRGEEFAPARFANARSADIRVEVPVAHLAPGEYLLTVEAGARTTVHRDSRFRIIR
jgi:VWFA-related protein